MRLEVKEWGNSKAVRLPKDFTNMVGLEIGDFLELNQVDKESFIIQIIPNKTKQEKKRLTLQQRLAMTKEPLFIDKEWDEMPAVGDEI